GFARVRGQARSHRRQLLEIEQDSCSHKDRVRFSISCTFFAQLAPPRRTEIVHVSDAGDWPIPTKSHNALFFGALSELARFLQRPVRAMH
ncbi:hypothetical protein ACTJJN_21485, partial [Pseudomonas sp. 22515]|uniref:hypothetical protein n=1 Tax=Pseudomonas sp. 22515 TaxID=3453934 RepID=UPI003F850CE7